LKEAYQIAFLVKERFFLDEAFLHRFEYYDSGHGVSLGGRSRIITLELSKLDRDVEKPVGEMTAPEHWAVYFRYLPDLDKRRKINEILEYEEGVAMASGVISRDQVERARLMSEFKYEVDTRTLLYIGNIIHIPILHQDCRLCEYSLLLYRQISLVFSFMVFSLKKSPGQRLFLLYNICALSG